MNSNPAAGDCKATGNPDDGYGSEANYEAGRDWDHNNAKVREMCKAYLKWLRNDIKIDGFRYDYCKGFHNSHINDYNTAAAVGILVFIVCATLSLITFNLSKSSRNEEEFS